MKVFKVKDDSYFDVVHDLNKSLYYKIHKERITIYREIVSSKAFEKYFITNNAKIYRIV